MARVCNGFVCVANIDDWIGFFFPHLLQSFFRDDSDVRDFPISGAPHQ